MLRSASLRSATFRSATFAGCLLLIAGCSSSANSTATTATTTVATTVATGYEVLTSAQGKALIDAKGASLTIIDVRTPAEFAAGHLANAVNSDLEGGQFTTFLKTLDKNAEYVVYCRTGVRAALAAAAMVKAGFTHVHDIGGILQWQAAGYPLVQ